MRLRWMIKDQVRALERGAAKPWHRWSQARSPAAREAVAPTVCLGPPRIDREGLRAARDDTIPASSVFVTKIGTQGLADQLRYSYAGQPKFHAKTEADG